MLILFSFKTLVLIQLTTLLQQLDEPCTKSETLHDHRNYTRK